MRGTRKGFTLVELLIVVVITGILAIAAMPLVLNNARDARRAEGEQLLGAARDFCRTEYAKTGSTANVTVAFTAQVATGGFTGNYFQITGFSDTSGVAGMDASVTTNAAADGTGTMDFTWESGTAAFTWS